MQSNEINIQDFVKDRESDIKILEKAINSSRKKTMAFQRLPFYKRRRTRSNFVKKKKSTRQRHRHFLQTHVWYAKRFKMIKINSIGLPLIRNQKSSKYIYKSQKRGFIFDESYKKVMVFSIGDLSRLNLTIDRNIINKIQLVETSEGHIEVIVTKLYCIIISPNEYIFDSEPVKVLESCISLIKMENIDLESFSKDIEGSIEDGKGFYVENDNDYESGKLFLKSKDVMNVWNDFILKGCIPVCIEELQRLAIENDYMIYPFDEVNSPLFKLLEDTQNPFFIEKYERTPKSKKVAINFEDLKIQTVANVFYYTFELEKGVLDKNGYIFKDGEIIGRIVRGSFCYTKGKSGGLCYTYKEVDLNMLYKAKNYDHENQYDLKMLKKLC